MELQLVTFNQAKNLKELGFPMKYSGEYCYAKDDGEWCKCPLKGNEAINYIPCPSLELAVKWLREKKNFFMSIDYHPSTPGYWENFYNYKDKYDYIHNDKNDFWDSYEEALSAGIDKAIEILRQQ